MQENREHFDCRCKCELFDAISKVRMYARSFGWRVRPISDLHAIELMLRLMNQSVLTRTAEAVGWKAVALGRVTAEGDGGGRGWAISKGGQLLQDLSK